MSVQSAEQAKVGVPVPRLLRNVTHLLMVNLALAVGLTVATIVLRRSLIDFQLDHRRITDPSVRATLRAGYTWGLLVRVFANVLISVVYAFMIRGLLAGRRWAYKRVIYVGVVGLMGLAFLQTEPYPTWMRIEQGAQAVVLLALLACVTRPVVQAYFDPMLPGRMVPRYHRQ